MTGLGTPAANLLVPDLVAYQGPGTSYSGPGVGPLQDATLTNTGTSDGGPIDVFSVFDAIGTMGNGRPAMGAADRIVTTYGLNRSNPLAGADHDGVRLESLTYAPAVGWMPLNSDATLDAALADWTDSHAAAKTPAQAGPVAGVRLPAVLAGPRTPVLQAAAVDSVLGTLGDWPSLSGLPGKKTTERIAANRSGGPA